MTAAATGLRDKMMLEAATAVKRTEPASVPALPENGEALYDYGETGILLRVSTPTLRRMVARGDLSAIRVGNQVRFLATELRRFLASAPSAADQFRVSNAIAGVQRSAA